MGDLSPLRETTASVAPIIIHGGNSDRYQLWLERTGQAQRDDLSNSFPVQWGKHNEVFCLDWIERVTQHEITERQNFVQHPTLPKISATLDGYRKFDEAVVEVKVLSAFSRALTSGLDLGFLDYYRPQVAVQMACRNAARGWLAVQQGNSAPHLYEIERSDEYADAVLERLAAFQLCVDSMTPPGPPPPAPVPPERWRAVDLLAENLRSENWVPALRPALDVWRDTREVAQSHEQAKKDVKILLPADVGLVSYGPITIKRARNGAVSIAQEEAA